MPLLHAPDRVFFQAAAPGRPDPSEDRRSARVAVASLRDREVSRVQVMVGPHGRVYVQWTD